jgi:hypothetical protein
VPESAMTAGVRLEQVGRSAQAVAGWKAHTGCDHTVWDALILDDPGHPDAEAWDAAAAADYRREHPA